MFCFLRQQYLCPPTEYKVTFDPDNGEEKTVVTVKEGETVAKPEKNPVKEGTAAFVAWVKEDGTEYNFEDKVTSDLTLKATYRTTLVVTFVNGEKSTAVNVEYGKTVDKPNVEVSRTVGGFASWRNKNNEIYDFKSPVTEDITLTASFWTETKSGEVAFDKGLAAYSLATTFDDLFRSGKSESGSGSLPTTDTTKTKTEIGDDNLKEILVYSLGAAKMGESFLGYWTYDGNNYYTSNPGESVTNPKYLYCELTKDESTDKVVTYTASTKTITVSGLKISAKFSEGTLSGDTISKKTDSPAFNDKEVSVVINGVESVKDTYGTYYKFDYTLDNDTKNPISVEFSSSSTTMTLTFSYSQGDYIYTQTNEKGN